MSVTVLGGFRNSAPATANFGFPFDRSVAFTPETAVTRAVRTPGRFTNFQCSIDNNGTSRSIVLRKSGTNSNVIISPADGTSGRFFDRTNDHWAATDTFVQEWIVTGTAFTYISYSYNFIADAGTWGLYQSAFLGNGATGPFWATLGQGFVSGAETSSAFVVRAPGTFKNFAVMTSPNTATGSNVFITRKNSANGNASVTVPATTTGTFEDTVNTDSLVSGNTIGFQNSSPANTGVTAWIGISCAHSGITSEVVGGNPSLSFSASNQFMSILGFDSSRPSETTETLVSFPLLVDGTLSNMRANIFSNTLTSTFTVNLRKNGANGNQLLTVAAGTSGNLEDTTHTDTFGTLDLLNYMGSGGTAGAISWGWAATTLTPMTFDWYVPLTEPVRQKQGLRASQQQFLAYSPDPLTIIPFSWFAALSEPPRFKPGLKPALQQFAAFDPKPFVSFSWMEPLSEPVRFKPGLRASQQQFLAQPAQLRPNPNITGQLAAFDKNHDVFLGGAQEWNRVASGEIGVIEASFTGAQIGVAKVPAITSARVSISIL
jgi:hypothetical protein